MRKKTSTASPSHRAKRVAALAVAPVAIAALTSVISVSYTHLTLPTTPYV